MDKKEFLEKFKKTVKNEGGDLSYAFIVQRVMQGDISESDISKFRKYIPIDLMGSIGFFMNKRAFIGVLKAAGEIIKDRSQLNENTTVEKAIVLIKENKVTQHDIQKFPKLMENSNIKKAIAEQIDRFLKEVLKHVSMTTEERNKHKFKLEKLLRRKIVTLNYLEGRSNIFDIIRGIFGDSYKKLLSEEYPYYAEIKSAIDSGYVDSEVIQYLPPDYVQIYMENLLRDYPSMSEPINYIRTKKGIVKVGNYPKTREVQMVSSPKIKPANIPFSEEQFLQLLDVLDKKEDKKAMSELAKKLQSLGFQTKSSTKKGRTTLDIIKNKYLKFKESKNKEYEKEQQISNRKPLTTNLYSVERKLEDIKKGKTVRYLSRPDRVALAQSLKKAIDAERTVMGKPSSSKAEVTSPVSSRSSSASSSPNGSPISSRRSSVVSNTSSKSSKSSKSSFEIGKERSPLKIPGQLIPVGKYQQGDIDTDTLAVISNFVNKSIAYSARSKKAPVEDTKMKIDTSNLMDLVNKEKERERATAMKRKRRKSSDGSLSPYDMTRAFLD